VVARGASNRTEKVTQFEQEMSANPNHSGDIPLKSLLASEQRREIQACLAALPEKCRQVMILRFTRGLPLAEIAELTDMPVGTVKSHVIRGVSRVRRLMKKG
jgi:RNA polymerase sigma-70 factor (ECF subfamily)